MHNNNNNQPPGRARGALLHDLRRGRVQRQLRRRLRRARRADGPGLVLRLVLLRLLQAARARARTAGRRPGVRRGVGRGGGLGRGPRPGAALAGEHLRLPEERLPAGADGVCVHRWLLLPRLRLLPGQRGGSLQLPGGHRDDQHRRPDVRAGGDDRGRSVQLGHGAGRQPAVQLQLDARVLADPRQRGAHVPAAAAAGGLGGGRVCLGHGELGAQPDQLLGALRGGPAAAGARRRAGPGGDGGAARSRIPRPAGRGRHEGARLRVRQRGL
mmetsp:Transcript_24994/g.43678  ORF Transcript_24994/g.43678 Transcript_24994/m.43678 type:complete len:270 (+) Transcript_24994:630-1439(+)